MIYPITNATVQIDQEDLALVSQYKWHLSSTGYAVWRGTVDGNKRTIRMHRLITGCPRGKVVDHINHDTLDNRRSNLRVCTQAENMRNLRDPGKGYWRQGKRFVVEVRRKHICNVGTEEEAKRVVALIRSGGTYVKPERTHCKYGHSLSDAYDYGDGKRCKKCQSIRSKQYHERKAKRING